MLIEPNVDPFIHSDFAKAKGLIAAGESATLAAMPRIRAAIGARKPVDFVRPTNQKLPPVARYVRFDGLVRTREQTIRREVLTVPGSRIDFSRLIDDLERLFHTGLFQDLNYRLENWHGDSVDVVFEVQERAYGFYSLGVRYDNADNVALGLEVGQGNLWGSGAGVRAALDLGNPNEVRLGLTGTRLFRLPFGYRLDGFWGSVSRNFYSADTWAGNYHVGYRGGVAEAGYILGRDAFFDLGLKAYQARYGVPRLFPVESLRAEWVVGPTFRLEVNNFHDIDFPTSGVASTLVASYSGPTFRATHQFLKLAYDWENVTSLNGVVLLRPGFGAGISFGHLAWAEQFRTGGQDFVGFPSEEFTSPQRAVVRLGIDIRSFRLFGQENYPFYLQLLSNVGTFVRLDSLVSGPDRVSMLHWGVGAGVRTNTPIGPVQLTLGVGDFGRLSSQRTSALWFSVGREFRYTR